MNKQQQKAVALVADVPAEERFYTVQEAADDYFQGKVSAREVYLLFSRGELLGFRVGAVKGKILIYASSLDAYRRQRENPPAAAAAPPQPASTQSRRTRAEPKIRLTRLPE
jgi:hypothetical protein